MAKKRDTKELMEYLVDSGTGESKRDIIGKAFAKGGSESEIVERMKEQGIMQGTISKIDSFMKYGRPVVDDDTPADLTIYATRDELHSLIRDLELRIGMLEDSYSTDDKSDMSTDPTADPLADLT